jgi:sigma-B regulation protein RsbU (phosphoserine phosphatase)
MVRFTLRAAAHAEDSPAKMLHALNEAMERGGQFCTVALVRLCRSVLTIALGGHPPAYLVRAGGEVSERGTYGTVIGSVENPRFTDVDLELSPGDSLFLYTDGVIEGGSSHGALGEEGLQRLLAETAGQHIDAIVDRIVDASIAVQDGLPRDDIAVLGFRFRGTGS